MTIPTVRSREGKPTIYWPGVFLATAVIVVVYSAGVAAFSLAVRWFSPMSFIGLPTLIVGVLGRSLRLGLRPPVAGPEVIG